VSKFTRASVRRERFGHITLAAPVSHIWFLKSLPSRLGILLGIQSSKLDRVIYYSAYIVTEVNEDQRKQALADLERELKSKLGDLPMLRRPRKTKTRRRRGTRNALRSCRQDPHHHLKTSSLLRAFRV